MVNGKIEYDCKPHNAHNINKSIDNTALYNHTVNSASPSDSHAQIAAVERTRNNSNDQKTTAATRAPLVKSYTDATTARRNQTTTPTEHRIVSQGQTQRGQPFQRFMLRTLNATYSSDETTRGEISSFADHRTRK